MQLSYLYTKIIIYWYENIFVVKLCEALFTPKVQFFLPQIIAVEIPIYLTAKINYNSFIRDVFILTCSANVSLAKEPFSWYLYSYIHK